MSRPPASINCWSKAACNQTSTQRGRMTRCWLVAVAVAAAIVLTTGEETPDAAPGPMQVCNLAGPVDLGRKLTTDSIYVTQPFVPGTLDEQDYKETKKRDNSFCVGEHTGTHLDAPFHYSDDGWAVDDIPVNRLIANGVFLDMSAEAAGNSSFRLQPSHIDAWIQRNGVFPENAFLLISYGWAQRYHNRSLYLGTTSTNFADFSYPGMSVEAATRLAAIPELVGVGVDTPSVDPPGTSDAHVILAANNCYNIEHVNLDQPCFPEKGFKVFAMPTLISRGTGAPARIIAAPAYGNTV